MCFSENGNLSHSLVDNVRLRKTDAELTRAVAPSNSPLQLVSEKADGRRLGVQQVRLATHRRLFAFDCEAQKGQMQVDRLSRASNGRADPDSST